MKELAVCGTNCHDCEDYIDRDCRGCRAIQGKVWWAKSISTITCPIYSCVKSHQTAMHCGQCELIPCALWEALKHQAARQGNFKIRADQQKDR